MKYVSAREYLIHHYRGGTFPEIIHHMPIDLLPEDIEEYLLKLGDLAELYEILREGE